VALKLSSHTWTFCCECVAKSAFGNVDTKQSGSEKHIQGQIHTSMQEPFTECNEGSEPARRKFDNFFI